MKSVVNAAAVLFVILSAIPSASAIDHEKELKSFGGFMVGTWTPKSQDDTNGAIKHVYKRVLSDRFIHVDGLQEDEPWIGMIGLDPKSKRLTWWGFFSDGSAGPVYLVDVSDKTWVFEGNSSGPDGNVSRRVAVTRTGDAALHAVVKDTAADSKETTAREADWVRHR